MDYPTPGTSTPSRVTSHFPFFGCNASGDRLFSVRADVPLPDALEQASCLLAVARDAAYQVAESLRSAAYGPAYLIEMAKAVVDSLGAVKPEPTAIASPTTLSSVVTFLEAQLADSRQQAEKEAGGAGKALYQGRASAFELALEMLREVAQ